MKNKTKPNVLKAVIRYNHSEKGKAKRKEWLEKNKEKYQDYQKKYRKERQRLAKQKGLCNSCYVRPTMLNYATCTRCHKRNLIADRRRREIGKK